MNLNIQRKLLLCLQQNYGRAGRTISKFSLTMKLTAVLILIASLHISAKTFSQKITLDVKNATLNSVLQEIRKQSNYKLIYNTDLLSKANTVSLKVNNASITETLNIAMTNQPFKFEIEGETILINPLNEPEKKLNTETFQVIITGKVVDESGKPLPGATVTEKGTKNYAQTNNDGNFNIKVSQAGAILVFSYIGYTSHEVAATNSMKIVLRSNNKLDEVIVTGYQKIDKTKFTGSVSQVDMKNIERSGSVDVSRMLQGAAAGVSVQNVSGTFGATPKIRIRGNASISANQEPLYVVNGVPVTSPANVSVSQLYSGDPASLLGSAIAGLNANDIEDISILKDGSATSLYGTRAANGVISITTKSGKKNQRNINFTTALSYGIKPKAKDFNLMDSYQETEFYNELYNMGYFANANWPSSTGALTETYRQYALRDINLKQAYAELDRSANANTDWFDVLFRNNILQEYNMSFSGGGEKNTYYLSGSYVNDNGQSVGFDMNRFTTNARSIFNLTKFLDLDINLNWNFRNQRTPGTLNSSTSFSEVTRQAEINPFLYAMRTSRAMYPYNNDGSYKYYLNNLAPFNIVEELNENFNTLKSQTVSLMIKPTVKLLPFLKYEGTFSIDRSNTSYDHTITERSNWSNAHRVDYNDVLRSQNTLLYKDPTNPFSVPTTILPKGGFLYSRSNMSSNYYVRNMLTANKKWENHSISGLVGMDINSLRTDYKYTKAIGYMYYGGKIISPSNLAYQKSVLEDDRLYIESFTDQSLVGYYGNFQYNYLNRYNLEGAMRFDTSNMFGKLARSKFLPNYSVGVSWNVEREPFFQKINSGDIVDMLKLKASYALRGNAYQGSPMLNAQYVNINRLDTENSETGIDITSPELFNLNWEKDYTTNVGFDLSLFGKINLTAEYYDRKNKNLVNSVNVAQEEGFTTKLINFANMSNKGVDVLLGINNILNNDKVLWSVNFIYGYVKNKVTDGELESSILSQITRPTGYPLNGYPLDALFAFKYNALNADGRPTFLRGNTPVMNIPTSERDRSLVEYVGSRQPTSTGSFATNVSYKNFDVRVFLTYSMGHKLFMSPIYQRNYSNNSSISADLQYRYGAPGDQFNTNIPALISPIQAVYLNSISNMDELAYNRSNLRVASGNNLRLSEILFSYDFGQNLLKNKSIKSARISFAANNIHYWASGKLRGVDPDLLLSGGTSMPNPKSYSLRLSVGL